jgi:hypothetical protein
MEGEELRPFFNKTFFVCLVSTDSQKVGLNIFLFPPLIFLNTIS